MGALTPTGERMNEHSVYRWFWLFLQGAVVAFDVSLLMDKKKDIFTTSLGLR